jgi:Druantia protein DruA
LGKPKQVVPLFSETARLKRAIRRHLKKIGFTSANGQLVYANEYSKDHIRQFHRAQRSDKLAASKALIAKWSDYKRYFASGTEVDPAKISPRLELIESRTPQSDLFAFASLYWSVPTSHGYGRRMRFLCWDDNNGKLIGLIALGDPVFNLTVRDDFIGWTGQDRLKRLACVMDAYVLGALPPYNALLCGKLLACILKSRDIYDYFYQKYYNYVSVISGKKRRAKLALITTSSSLGRSSVYNRLKIGDQIFLKSVGQTKGFGHFHIPNRLFDDMRDYLERNGHYYASGHTFGEGANWRMRVIRETLSQLGLPAQLLRHGIAREVFVAELARNSREFLQGKDKDLDLAGFQTLRDIGDAALQRWVLPRAARTPDFRSWDRDDFVDQLKPALAAPEQLLSRQC